ncbi:hypothetical protein HMI54_013197, partial [Coelomomyces lativittatus]
MIQPKSLIPNMHLRFMISHIYPQQVVNKFQHSSFPFYFVEGLTFKGAKSSLKYINMELKKWNNISFGLCCANRVIVQIV